MSDYMAQKADEQIEAGLRERDSMLSKIDSLISEINELNAKVKCYEKALDKISGMTFFGSNIQPWVNEAIIALSQYKVKNTQSDECKEPDICRACNGSGEGYYATNDKCLACDGKGIEK